MKSTLQQLVNVVMFSWETEKELGFYVKDPTAFRKKIDELSDKELQALLEHLSELFRSVREIGCAEVEIKLEGQNNTKWPLMETG